MKIKYYLLSIFLFTNLNAKITNQSEFQSNILKIVTDDADTNINLLITAIKGGFISNPTYNPTYEDFLFILSNVYFLDYENFSPIITAILKKIPVNYHTVNHLFESTKIHQLHYSKPGFKFNTFPHYTLKLILQKYQIESVQAFYDTQEWFDTFLKICEESDFLNKKYMIEVLIEHREKERKRLYRIPLK